MPPLATSSTPSSASPRANVVEPGLVVDGDQRALDHGDQLPTTLAAAAGARPPGSARAASRRVAGRDRHGLLRDHRAACRRPRRRSGRSPPSRRRRPRARPRSACAPGKAGRSDGWTLTTRPGKRSRKRASAGACSPAQTTSVDAVLARASRPSPGRAPRGSRSRRAEDRRRDARPPRPARARARPACSRRPRRSAGPRRSAPAGSCPRRETRTPITSQPIRPITSPLAGVAGSGTTAHIADAEVEDAPLLLLVDACSASHAKTGGRSHASQSISAPSPSGRTRARLPRMPPPVTCASALHVGARAQRAHVVEVEPRRREQEVGVEVARRRASARTSVKPFAWRPADGKPSTTSPGLDSASRRSAGRARRGRRTCRRSRARPRGRCPAARRSRRRGARSRPRGRPRPRPRRARRPARGRAGARRRSRGRRAARRRS